jgi:hypothetical protein
MAGLDFVTLFRLRGSNRVIPLPAITEDWRDAVPLDVDVVRSALWHHAGNITMSARYLRVEPSRLRRFVTGNSEFADDLAQIDERLCEFAKSIVEAESAKA